MTDCTVPVPLCAHGLTVVQCRTCRDFVVPAEQSETLADLRAQLDALRAVVQEALDLHSGRAQLNPALCETCLEARPCDTFFILDRGLKGGEE